MKINAALPFQSIAGMSVTEPEAKQSAGMLLGIIEPPHYLWSPLKVLSETPGVRNGVLVVYSEQLCGRLGIFCNRYISGGLIDGTMESGRPAVLKLISAKSGSFLFRPCMPAEGSELKQELALDILELLFRREEDGSATLKAYIAPAAGQRDKRTSTIMVFGGDNVDLPQYSELLVAGPTKHPAAKQEQLPAAPVSEAQIQNPSVEGPISYLDLFTVKQDDRKSNRISKIRQVLDSALPADAAAVTAGGGHGENTADTLLWYQKFIEREFEQLHNDMSSTDRRTPENLLADLKTFQDLWKIEQERVNKWKSGFDTDDGLAGALKTQPQAAARFQLAGGGAADDLVSDPKILQSATANLRGCEPHYTRSRFGSASVWYQVALPIATMMIVAVTLGAWYQRAADSYLSFLGQAEKSLEAGFPQVALLSFKSAESKYPGSAVAHLGAALSYAQLQDSNKADQELDSADQLGARQSSVLLAKAIAEARSGIYEGAIRDCEQLLTKKPDNLVALKVRAICRLRVADWQRASDDLQRVLKLGKEPSLQPSLRRELGFAQFKLGNLQAAVDQLTQALAGQDDEWAYLNRADAYRQMKEYKPAADDYSSVLKIDPASYSAYVARGICLANLDQNDSAAEDFAHALRLKPEGVEALIQQGSLKLKDGQWQAAADDLSRALQLNPYVKETQDKLKLAKAHLPGQAAAAPAVVQGAGSDRAPFDAQALLSMGYKRLKEGDANGASSYFAEVVKREPANLSARTYLAYALEQLGDYGEAATQFTTVAAGKKLEPEDSLMLAHCYFKGGDHETAVEVLKRLLESQPNFLKAQAELADVYYSSGFPRQGYELCKSGYARAKTDAERKMFGDLLNRYSSQADGEPAKQGK